MVTAAAVVFALILIISLIVNLAAIPGEKRKEAALQAELKTLTDRSKELDNEMAYHSSDAWIERYAREYLAMLSPGEEVFIPR